MAYPRPNNVDLSMGTIPSGREAIAQGINDMVVCTYDESHLVSGGRYFAHIEGCRKAFQANGGDTSKMLKCPFRSSHHVAAEVMDKHIQLCDGYYDWHTNNQPEPPSMKKAQLLHIMSDDDEEASEEGEAGIPNLTDFTIPVTVTDSEDTTTTTGSYMTATDFSSDESHIDNE